MLQVTMTSTLAEFDEGSQLISNDDDIIFMHFLCVLGLEDHDHEDGVLEVGLMPPLLFLDFLVSKDQTNDSLNHLLLDQ
jgi:hypothetical protein